MNTVLRSSLAVLVAAGGLMGASAFAQGAAPGTDARMQRERAVCDGIQQDRVACLREAGAAREEARRGGLTTPAPMTNEQNALARCSLQPPADRDACEARVRGTGMTSIDGSVMGGGVIRETVTPISAPISAPMPAPMPAPVR
jgi:hypothetical protein